MRFTEHDGVGVPVTTLLRNLGRQSVTLIPVGLSASQDVSGDPMIRLGALLQTDEERETLIETFPATVNSAKPYKYEDVQRLTEQDKSGEHLSLFFFIEFITGRDPNDVFLMQVRMIRSLWQLV